MSDTTLTMGSNLSLTVSGGTEVGVAGANTITFAPAANPATFSISVVPGVGVGFLGSFNLPTVPIVSFSPTAVGLSNGQYVFTVTSNVPAGGSAMTGSCNLIFTTAPGATVTRVPYEMHERKDHTTTCDPTMIFDPPD
jgi:hypothetical protein